MSKGTFTLTLGEQSENHKGMEIIGDGLREGLSYKEMKALYRELKQSHPDVKFELVKLHRLTLNCDEPIEREKACVLVIRNGVNLFVNPDELLKEQLGFDWDKKAFMYGEVRNKNARYNVCYGKEGQEPDYENKKGRIVAYRDVPLLKKLRKGVGKFSEKTKKLNVEGNWYYDQRKCGIGWHGDGERNIVIGVRLGEELPLCFRWYYKAQIVSEKLTIDLKHGDMYIMSQKATGSDWKKRNLCTLRHAAGCDKYTK